MAKQLSLLLHGGRGVEKEAATGNQLLALAGQKKPAPDAIEEPQAQFLLEIHDLS